MSDSPFHAFDDAVLSDDAPSDLGFDPFAQRAQPFEPLDVTGFYFSSGFH